MHETPLLNEDIAQLIQRGVFIKVIASSMDDEPLVSRALGCRIANDHGKVVVLFSAACPAIQFGRLRGEGAIEVVFTMPASNQTVEIKGREVRFVALQNEDFALIENHRRKSAAEFVSMGKREFMARSIVPEKFADIVALCFTPTAAFIQRPRRTAWTMPHEVA